MEEDLQAELRALAAVVEALLTVPSDVRSRILAYAYRRFPEPVTHRAGLVSGLVGQQALQANHAQMGISHG